MSNPTTGVWQFDNSLSGETQLGALAFTGVAPIHFADGLLLQQATTNYAYNPVANVGLASFTAGAAATPITRVTSLPGPLPAPWSSLVTTGVRVDITGAVLANQPLIYLNLISTVSGAHQNQVALWIPSAFTAPQVNLSTLNFGGGGFSQNVGLANMALRDQWQIVPADMTLDASDLVGVFMVTTQGGAATIGDYLFATMFSSEPGTARTTPAVGSFGSGYAFTGTANNSPSTRAASSASVPTAGIISSLSGSLAFRFTRKLDTGTLEPILEVGENDAGHDHLQMFIDGDTLWVAWDSNGALPQTIDTGHTMVVDQEYFIYTYWDDLVFGISIDNGTPMAAQRDVPTGDWGTFPLTLEAA